MANDTNQTYRHTAPKGDRQKSIVGILAFAPEYHTRWSWLIATCGYLVTLTPHYGIIPNALHILGRSLELNLVSLNLVFIAIALPFLLCSGARLWFQGNPIFYKQDPTSKPAKRLKIPIPFLNSNKEPYIEVLGMRITLTDLKTNHLITGQIGTGKTSRVVFPIIEAIFNKFNQTTTDVKSRNPLQQLGGLFIDVKGEFFEGIAYTMHKAGRHIADELFVITPYPYISTIQLEDPEHGTTLFLSSQVSSKGGCFSELIKNSESQSIRDLPDNYISERTPMDEIQKTLIGSEFNVENTNLRFLTWRKIGNQLHRARGQKGLNDPEFLEEGDGPNKIPYPKKLIITRIGIQRRPYSYNIIDPRKKPIDIGKRLATLGSLVKSSSKSGGDKNDYFNEVAERALTRSIMLLRLVYPKKEVSAPDILNIILYQSYLDKQLKIAEQVRRDTEKQFEQANGFEKVTLKEKLNNLEDCINYFIETWSNEDQRQKGTFKNIIENMFTIFTMDGNLRETFCQPRTFSFEDCCQKGKNFIFVAGEEYADNSRLIATALKMDFQDTMLNRLRPSGLNKNRLVIFGNDEAQENIVSSGASGAGDVSFMSKSRQANVFNLICTQSFTSIDSALGSKAEGDAYRQNFGLMTWLKNTDRLTCDEAARICGTKTEYKLQDDDSLKVNSILDTVSSGKSSRPKGEVKDQKRVKAKYESHEIIELKRGETITWNAGEDNKEDNTVKTVNEFSHVTDPNNTEIIEIMRDFFQQTTEKAILDAGTFDDYNPHATSNKSELPPAEEIKATPHEAPAIENNQPIVEPYGPIAKKPEIVIEVNETTQSVIQDALEQTNQQIEHESIAHDNTVIDFADMVNQSNDYVAKQIEGSMQQAAPEHPQKTRPSDIVSHNDYAIKEGLANQLREAMAMLQINPMPDVSKFVTNARARTNNAADDELAATCALVGPNGIIKGNIELAKRSKPTLSNVDVLSNLRLNSPKEVPQVHAKILEDLRNKEPKTTTNKNGLNSIGQRNQKSKSRYLRSSK